MTRYLCRVVLLLDLFVFNYIVYFDDTLLNEGINENQILAQLKDCAIL